MKKFFSILFIVVLAVAPMFSFVVKASEEIEEPQVAEIEEQEPTLDEFKDKVSEWLGQYMESELVMKIVNWAMDAGVLSALLAVYIKYKKYKHTTLDDLIKQQKSAIEEEIKKRFNELSEGEIAKITEALGSVEEASQTIMKVLVLMQDNTAKGRAALIEYLGSKTNSGEVKEATKQVADALEEQIEQKEEVKKQFEEIF